MDHSHIDEFYQWQDSPHVHHHFLWGSVTFFEVTYFELCIYCHWFIYMSLANEHSQSNLHCLFILLPDATSILRFRVKILRDSTITRKNMFSHSLKTKMASVILRDPIKGNLDFRLLSLKMLGKSAPNIFSQILVQKWWWILWGSNPPNKSEIKNTSKERIDLPTFIRIQTFCFAGRLTFLLFNASWLALWLPSPNWSQRLTKHHILLTDTSLHMTQHGHATSWWFQSIKQIFPQNRGKNKNMFETTT